METIYVDLGIINGTIPVQIVRKKIKNVHLKVYRTLEVSLSVPYNVPNEWIENFLISRKNWIGKQIMKYKESSGYNLLANIGIGTSVQLLGNDMRIYRETADVNHIEIDEKRITIFTKDVANNAAVQKEFEKWLRKYAAWIYEREMGILFDTIFRKYNVKKPIVVIKKMKTLWGSCTPQKNKITLNEYLLKADIRCIQYVILHELTHLLYPNHSKQFYDFLTIQMPDWKERKKQLDTEVVQGL